MNIIISFAIVFINDKGVNETKFIMAFLGCFLVTFIIYYAISEYKFQRTFGKFITGTIVVTYTGKVPSIGDTMRRAFLRLLPFDSLTFLFSRNGFHDKFSDTRVIKGNRMTDKIAPADILHN